MTYSSGDLLLDRRFAWAEGLSAEGDHAAAADLLDDVVEAAPDWAPGWQALARAREAMGDRAGALAAWRRVAALDPEGTFGSDLHLARLGNGTPGTMPAPYVRALFDDYAPRFERHLTEALAYRGPALLIGALDRVAPRRRFGRALDLGCGTGLMARALAGRTARIEGIDIAPGMVEAARRTGLYDTLGVASLEEALAAAPPGCYDLVAAADVLPYLGDLAGTFADVARALTPDGLFAFTAQALAQPNAAGFALGADLRFAHAPASVEADLARAGLAAVHLASEWARRESGAPVPGLVAVARRA